MDFSLQEQHSSKKFTGLAIVVFLHVLIAYIVATARTDTHPPRVMPDPVTTVLPPLIEPKPEPVLLDPAKRVDVKSIVIEPPVVAGTEPAINTLVDTTYLPPTTTGTLSGGGENIVHQAVRIAAVVDPKACEKPDYPSAAVAQGLEGVTTLAFLIGVDGRVVGSRLEQSSGTKSLDSAALAGLSRCKFKPATVDGVAEQSWTKIQYVWKLD